jgi:hypothetical protein
MTLNNTKLNQLISFLMGVASQKLEAEAKWGSGNATPQNCVDNRAH